MYSSLHKSEQDIKMNILSHVRTYANMLCSLHQSISLCLPITLSSCCAGKKTVSPLVIAANEVTSKRNKPQTTKKGDKMSQAMHQPFRPSAFAKKKMEHQKEA